MYSHHHWIEDGPDHETAERQTAGLASIVVVLLLLIGGLFLVQQLRAASELQDCLMAGRRNCAVLVAHRH